MEQGFIDILHILLNTTEDRQLLNDQTAVGVIPLAIAVGNNQSCVVRLLLDFDETDVNLPDYDGWTPVYWAAFKGFDEIAT